MPKNQTRSKWFTALYVVLGLVVLSFILALIVSAIIGNDFENLHGNVAIIEISGPIVAQESDSLFLADVVSSDDIRRLLRRAKRDEGIKAVVLEINSPGGSAVASDEIAREVKKLNKTTVAWIREIGASGAYWIASSSDHIIANRMSITGSIGVIASYLNFAGFIEDHNISYERLISGELKDIGTPFKDLTPEERSLFQKNLDQIRDYFIEEVAGNRNLNKKDIEKVATGAFYLGVDAKELNLVDELGSRDEVIKYLKTQIDEDVDFVRFKTSRGLLGAFGQTLNERFYFIGLGIGDSFKGSTEPKSVIRT